MTVPLYIISPKHIYDKDFNICCICYIGKHESTLLAQPEMTETLQSVKEEDTRLQKELDAPMKV